MHLKGMATSYADLESFFQSGSKADNFFFSFLDDKGIEDTNTAINEPSSTAVLVAL